MQNYMLERLLERISLSEYKNNFILKGGFLISIALYPPLAVPLTVDITTGDKITPREIEYTFKLLFDNKTISIMAYNLETVLAEKLETVISRGQANTRPRDFYDIHILYSLRGNECDTIILKQALQHTAEKRGSSVFLKDYKEIICSILNNKTMQKFWNKYRQDFSYARDLTFDAVCATVVEIMDKIKI